MSDSEREHKDQLWSEATFWFARMRSPDAEEFRAEFEQWLARGALHRRYYNRASEHWLQSTAAFADERAQIDAERNNAPQPSSRPWRKRSTVAGLVAASLVIAASTAVLVQHHRATGSLGGTAQVPTKTPPMIAQFATRSGEQRRVQLADGSTIILGGGTTIRVRLGTGLRRLDLQRGSARFAVAHEARPFMVFAGGGAVTAHGTVFDVAIAAGNRVSVRLIRGSVDVRFPPGNSSHAAVRRLHPGESVSFAASGEPAYSLATAPAPARQPPSTSAAAPLTVSREYRDVRLADVLAEANHHAAPPIRLADPATGERRVSGRFRVGDNLLLADRIAALLDLTVDRSSPSAIVLRPR